MMECIRNGVKEAGMGLKIWQVGCWNFYQNESWNCASKDDVHTNLLLFCKVIWFQKAYVNLTAFNFDYYFQWKIVPWHLVVNWGFLFWFLIFWQMQLAILLLQSAEKHTWNVFFSPTNQYTSSIHFSVIYLINTLPRKNGVKISHIQSFGTMECPRNESPYRVAGLPTFGFTLLAILQPQIIKILRDNTS